MPINECLMKGLKKTYGKKAKSVYYAMENKGASATKKSSIAKCKRDYPSLYKKKTTKKKRA